MLVIFTNLSDMKFQVRYLALFLLFSVVDGFEWYWMGSLLKNIQLMLELLNAPFLVLQFSYLYINDFSDNVICDIAIYADNANLYYKFNQASDMWQQLELASELGAGSCLLISMLKKLSWFCLTGLIILVQLV